MSVCVLGNGDTYVNTPIATVDYKSLFEKYVKAVLDCEGEIYDEPPYSNIKFTDIEKQEFERVRKEWSNEN